MIELIDFEVVKHIEKQTKVTLLYLFSYMAFIGNWFVYRMTQKSVKHLNSYCRGALDSKFLFLVYRINNLT